MQISSTTFQQNVGYYLRMADEGETITIRKLKPTNAGEYRLVAMEPSKVNKYSPTEILKRLDKMNLHGTETDGVAFQRRVRS